MTVSNRILFVLRSLLGRSKTELADQDALQLVDNGIALEKQGRIDDAINAYSTAIQLVPGLARAHLNYGNALLRMGRTDEAINSFQAAITHKPDYAGAYNNLGITLKGVGQLDAAAENFRRAIEINSAYADAYNGLGGVLHLMGRLEEAEAGYRRALEIKPDFAEACFNLARLYRDQGSLSQAETGFKQMLQINPEAVDACFNLGVIYMQLGRLHEAEAIYRRALDIRPNFAEACYNLGNTLKDMGRREEAEVWYRRALDIRPNYAEGHNNLGIFFQNMDRLNEAEASYRRALEINPILIEAYYNLGNTLQDMGRLSEAEATYRQALEITPDFSEARVALVMLTLLIAPKTVNEATDVSSKFGEALNGLSVWLEGMGENKVIAHRAVCAKQPFFLAYREGNHVGLLSRYGNLVSECAKQTQPISPPVDKGKRRIVIVSRYFYRHSVWFIILRGLLTHLDRQKFEIVLYHFGYQEDVETEQAKLLADVWRDTRTVFGFEGWLDAMMSDQPDVIFYPEIGMDPISLRLASHRLAPLQVASWGHPITTGLPHIDLYLSGELIESLDADAHYREKLVRLPGTGCCTTPIKIPAEKSLQLEALLAKRSGPRFVIAQSPFKFDPADDELFANIAANVGNSTFIMFRPIQFSWALEIVMGRLHQAFRTRGLVPENHLLVVPWMPQEQFYYLLDICDVFLDCPCFSGYTTAWQAIHRGIPIVTLEGKFLRQRLAAGLLRKIGITDTIAMSTDHYVTIAMQLAVECQDKLLREARRLAIKTAAPLMDNDVSVVRAFEAVLMDTLVKNGR